MIESARVADPLETLQATWLRRLSRRSREAAAELVAAFELLRPQFDRRWTPDGLRAVRELGIDYLDVVREAGSKPDPSVLRLFDRLPAGASSAPESDAVFVRLRELPGAAPSPDRPATRSTRSGPGGPAAEPAR